jgi:hypothetical protein
MGRNTIDRKFLSEEVQKFLAQNSVKHYPLGLRTVTFREKDQGEKPLVEEVEICLDDFKPKKIRK